MRRNLIYIAAASALATMPIGIAKAGTLTTLYTFGGTNQSYPKMFSYQNGFLYGVSEAGGKHGLGAAYQVDLKTNSAAVIYSFSGGAAGRSPSFAFYHGGNVFANAEDSVGNSHIFDDVKVGPGKAKVLESCCDLGNLVYDQGIFYGTVGFAPGQLVEFDPKTAALSILYTFTGEADGAEPADLVYNDGMLYGATSIGGQNNQGGVFSFNLSTGAETTLASFSFDTGEVPSGPLVYENGILYGVANAGGLLYKSYGTAFSVTPSTGAIAPVYVFQGGADGANPRGSFVYLKGEIYGVTSTGGQYGNGTIFEVDVKTGSEKVLYSFTGGQDGANPNFLIYGGGTFYGTTGGMYGTDSGTVFQFNP